MRRVPRRMIAFLTGFLVGFGGLAVAGAMLPYAIPFEPFRRFPRDLAPQTLFYPTAAHIEALTLSRFVEGRTMVIIGGNSILRGVGQHTGTEWSAELSRLLGDKFTVLNLAANGGWVSGYGYTAARLLLEQGKPVIFIANLPSGFRADGHPFYRNFYYDALVAGLLPRSADREMAPTLSPEDQRERQELLIKAWTNRLFHTDDLWTTLGYCCFFTTWTRLTANGPWMARRDRPDPDAAPFPHYSMTDADMEVVHRVANQVRWLLPDQVATLLPPDIAKRTIFAITGESPFYLPRLSEEERKKMDASRADAVTVVEAAGAHAVIVGELTAHDFIDHTHLSPRGGRALAQAVAPVVRRVAEEEGYPR